jgi:hypothetical protein
MRTATADVSDSICGMTAAVSERAAGCCHAERTPTIPTTWTRPWPAIAAVPDPVSGCAARELPCPRGYRRDHYVSTLVAGGRTLAGHPSGASDRRGHQHGHRRQRGHVCRTQPVRTVVIPEAADGQSADRSLITTSSTLLKAGPEGGRLRRPSSRRQRRGGHRGTGLTFDAFIAEYLPYKGVGTRAIARHLRILGFWEARCLSPILTG